jgi:hypothetical protein
MNQHPQTHQLGILSTGWAGIFHLVVECVWTFCADLFFGFWFAGCFFPNFEITCLATYYHDAFKHWFLFETKGLRGHQIDWLVWRLITTIPQHYMHTIEMKKKRFMENKVVDISREQMCRK